jgi:hypothetical protein
MRDVYLQIDHVMCVSTRLWPASSIWVECNISPNDGCRWASWSLGMAEFRPNRGNWTTYSAEPVQQVLTVEFGLFSSTRASSRRRTGS